MKKQKFKKIGIVGCLTASSLIGNSGCSMMGRDYYLDEYGQRHYVDTEKERLGEDAAGLLSFVKGGILGVAALKLASGNARRDKVALAQQEYLRERLAEQSKYVSDFYKQQSLNYPVFIYYCREWKDFNGNGQPDLGEMIKFDGIPFEFFPTISNGFDKTLVLPKIKFNFLINLRNNPGGEISFEVWDKNTEKDTYAEKIDISDTSKRTFPVEFKEGLPSGFYRVEVKLNNKFANGFLLKVDENLSTQPSVFSQRETEN